jgi:hypothetical protein
VPKTKLEIAAAEEKKSDEKDKAELALMAAQGFVLIAIIDGDMEVVTSVECLSEAEMFGLLHYVQVVLPMVTEDLDGDVEGPGPE